MARAAAGGWIIVSVPSSEDPARLDRWLGTLAESCEGIVTVGARLQSGAAVHAGAAPAQGGRLGRLLTGLHAVPDHVRVVTLVEQEALETVGAAGVAAMLGPLGEAAGAVRCLPVTDALKRVEDGMLREVVAREGLFMPRTPQTVRRAALAEALHAAPDGGIDDPSVLLAATGHLVRVHGNAVPGAPSSR